MNILTNICIAAGYLLFYLPGRIIRCDIHSSNLIGLLFTAKPTGEHGYLYKWLLNSSLFVIFMLIFSVTAFFGKHKNLLVTVSGFIINFLAGLLFDPTPEGIVIGKGHYGWRSGV